MSGTMLGIIIAAVVAVIVIVLIIFLVSRRSRARREEEQRERTREEFGSEYERTAQKRGSEHDAEKELRERRASVERQVEPLSEESQGRYEEQWAEVERIFVDNPTRSIEMADRTVSDILSERKFVASASQSDEETEKGLAAMHPEVADDYREARRMRAGVVARGAESSGEGSEESSEGNSDENTEELRRTIQRYRAVYEKIVRG